MRSPDPGQNTWLCRVASARLPAILRSAVAASIALLAGYQLATQITDIGMDRSEPAVQNSSRSNAADETGTAPEAISPVETLVLDVQPGDTLESMFRESGLSLVDLTEILQLDTARQNLRKLRPGDTLMLCTDGLTDLVWDDEIQKIVRSKKDLKAVAETLVNLANERGGHDNITVVLLAMPRLEETTPNRHGLFDWLLGD